MSVIDATQFLIEPPDFWTSRVAAKQKEMAPHVIPLAGGGEGWAFESGAWIRPLGVEACASRSPVEFKSQGLSYKDIRKGMHQAKDRLEDMRIDGIDAACIFPTFGMELRSYRDPDLHTAYVRAYNDGVLEWTKSGDAKRLIPQAIIPAVGSGPAIEELKRVIKLGFKGVIFMGWPNGGEKPIKDDDAFWSACAEAGVAINLVRGGPLNSDRTPSAPKHLIGPNGSHVRVSNAPIEFAWAQAAAIQNHNLTWFTFSGILDRFPSLRLSIVDCGAGWLPTCVELYDWLYRYERFLAFARLKYMPSDYVRRQVSITVNGERSTIAARADFNPDALMWSSNYPSHSSTWPSSVKEITDLVGGIPEAERRRIAGENCAKLYGIKLAQPAGAAK
jgi:predicted TIM-barrel fold metal-dependent hydrolase